MVTALSRHQEAAKARQGASGATEEGGGKGYLQGEGPVLAELQELAERMACTAVDAQRDHPIGFRRYVGVPRRCLLLLARVLYDDCRFS